MRVAALSTAALSCLIQQLVQLITGQVALHDMQHEQLVLCSRLLHHRCFAGLRLWVRKHLVKALYSTISP